MKRIMTIIILMVFTLGYAQNQRDVVYLKNGSIIKGSIVEMSPSKGIKVKTSDGSIFVYKLSEVLKTEKEEFIGKKVNQNTSSEVSQTTLEGIFKNYIQQNRPALKFIGISKVNGIKKNIFGQKIYEIEYQLILEPIKNIFINKINSPLLSVGTSAGNFKSDFSYALQQADSRMSAFGGSLTLVEKEKRILIEGSLPFEETDNGWRPTKFSNKNYRIVSSNYMTPEMAKRKSEEQAKVIEALKKNLDWRKRDIAPVTFENKYFRTENVPVFSDAHVRYFISPLKGFYKGRNDVAKEIADTFYKSLLASNRYSETESDSYTSAENSSSARFTISNVSFPFVNTGYQCKITLRGRIKGTYTHPQKFNANFSIPPIIASSNSFKKGMSKQEALDSALRNLMFKIQDFVYTNEPITLEIKRIETNKKGKAEKIIFESPIKFVNAKKMKFLIINPNDISIQNNAFIISNKVGECTSKRSKEVEEIECKIRGNKNKKALSRIKEKAHEFIGVSTR